jgi:serine/threonine protein kinase
LSGTQLYMAPELFSGKPASIRSDIYALGVVLYQLLAGDFRRPVTTPAGVAVQRSTRVALGPSFDLNAYQKAMRNRYSRLKLEELDPTTHEEDAVSGRSSD